MHKFPKKPSEPCGWLGVFSVFSRCAEACANFAQPLCIESHALVPSLLGAAAAGGAVLFCCRRHYVSRQFCINERAVRYARSHARCGPKTTYELQSFIQMKTQPEENRAERDPK